MERDVSLATGSMVYNALREKGHQAILIDVYCGYDGEDADCPERLFESARDWSQDVGKVGETNPDLEDIKSLRKENSDCYFGH